MQMLGAMSAVEWEMWKVYLSLNPVGQDRDDLRTAQISQAIWNVQIAKATGRGRTPQYRRLMEFMLQIGDRPDPNAPTKRQTAKEQWAILKATFMKFAKKKKKDPGA
jgi:hypothetical protein